MDRPRAERLHVRPSSPPQTGQLADGFRQVPAAALVAITHGLLPASEQEIHRLGRSHVVQKPAQRQGPSYLRSKILEQDRSGERVIPVVPGQHHPCNLIMLVAKRLRTGLSGPEQPVVGGARYLGLFKMIAEALDE